MSDTPKIEPCMFCGCGAVSVAHVVVCTNGYCAAVGPIRKSDAEAVAKWNAVARAVRAGVGPTTLVQFGDRDLVQEVATESAGSADTARSNAGPRCEKCGGVDINTLFVREAGEVEGYFRNNNTRWLNIPKGTRNDHGVVVATTDVLKRHCRACQWWWTDTPLDKEPALDPRSNDADVLTVTPKAGGDVVAEYKRKLAEYVEHAVAYNMDDRTDGELDSTFEQVTAAHDALDALVIPALTAAASLCEQCVIQYKVGHSDGVTQMQEHFRKHGTL